MTPPMSDLPLWSALPFVGMLLSIAILPQVAYHWFEENRNRGLVAAGWGLPVLVFLLAQGAGGRMALLHTAHEYVEFVVLLVALFAVAGGVYITGNLVGTPGTCLAFLAAGAVLANLVGTTGAAMLLIRPLVRAVSERTHKVHVIVFFIFVVCNGGGLLTPLADPPLFLGFLRGVPFTWTLTTLWPEWLVMVGLILAAYLAFEVRYWPRETVRARREDEEDYLPLGVAGRIQFLYLAGVIAAVLASAPLARTGIPLLREVLLAGIVLLSLRAAPSGPRAANHFSWGPMQEVAILFAGIFVTMIPPLEILRARGGELGLEAPWHYFWATGVLSSFLDNAPTYLVFLSTAQGATGAATALELATGPHARILAAISCGAVFFGANSYIGNAPNFMVRAIAESNGVKMPSFFAYMGWAATILYPLYLIHTLLFFR